MWSPLQRVQICLILAAYYGGDLCVALGIGPRTVSYTNSTTSSTRPSSSSFSSSHSTSISSSSHSTSLSSSSYSSSLSSSSHSSTNSSVLEGPLVTPTPTLLSISSTANYSSTITSAPAYPWGNQIIPVNTCSVTATDGSIQYTPCEIFAGTIQMSYFPENQGNLSYPATYWNPNFGVTMTSPSVYMMVNTLTGDNSCGPLGPTYVNEVISMDLTDVSTLQPYADHTVTTRMGPPQALTLSDITSDCFNTYGTFSTDGAFVNTHPVFGNYNRCRPRFVPPIELKRVGYPYWMHCANDDWIFGIFDPPGAVPPVVGLLPTTVAAPVTSTYDPASALPTAASDQAASTTAPQPQNTPAAASSPAPADPSTPVDSSAPTAIPPVQGPENPATTPSAADPSTPPSDPPPADPTVPVDPASAPTPAKPSSPADPVDPASPGTTLSHATPSTPANPSILHPSPAGHSNPSDPSNPSPPAKPKTDADLPASSNAADPPIVTPSIPIPTSATAIAIVGSQTISAIPGSSGVVLPNGSTATPGAVATVTDSNSKPIVVSVGTSGVFIGGTSSGDPTSFYANPTVPPVAIATVASQVVSAAPGATHVVVGSQTASLGGAPITVSGSVIQLTPSGVVVNDASGESASTYAIPTFAGAQDTTPSPIATVGEQIISAAPGATNIVVGSQTAALGGAPITVAGSVIQLTPSGVVVNDGSGGPASIYAIPTSTSVDNIAPAAIATVAGQVISAAPGATNIIVGSQTAALGGSPITVAGSVIQLTPSGVVVNDGSGGPASIYAIPTPASGHNAAPVAIATVAGQVISAAPGATNIVVGSQTASLGGPPITVGSSIIQLTPSGVVVNDGSGGPAITYAIPTSNAVAPTPIATIGGQIISAAPGASTVVINGQIVTANGSPVTLAGSNNVASLGPSGLIVQYPGGSISTFALPTPAPSASIIVGTVAGFSISATAGAPVISIGTQPVTLGGSPVTISNEVVSLGPSGLEIQLPGGVISTISAQAESAGVVTSSSSSSGKGIASAIASIAGATQANTGTTSAAATLSTSAGPGESSPTPVTKSGAGKIVWGDSSCKLAMLWVVLAVLLI